MSQSRRPSKPWILSLALGAAASFSLAACGAKEASEMSKFADKMCECKDVACADKLFPEIEKLATANEGKEVVAAVADHYNSEMDRTQKCYEKIYADAETAEGEAPAAE